MQIFAVFANALIGLTYRMLVEKLSIATEKCCSVLFARNDPLPDTDIGDTLPPMNCQKFLDVDQTVFLI